MDKGYGGLMRQILSDPTHIVDIKKDELQILLTWLSMSRLESNHDPKFLLTVEIYSQYARKNLDLLEQGPRGIGRRFYCLRSQVRNG